MKGLLLLLVSLLLTFAHADKVTWDSNGNPHIEKSEKPREGCQQAELDDLGVDNNKSDC